MFSRKKRLFGRTKMVWKLLPVGLMIVALVFSVQTANAQWELRERLLVRGAGRTAAGRVERTVELSPRAESSSASSAPSAGTAVDPDSMDKRTAKSNAQTQPNNRMTPANGQMAQSNNQTYQSFSAEPAPVYSERTGRDLFVSGLWRVQRVRGFSRRITADITDNGNQSWRRWDNAGNHGFPGY